MGEARTSGICITGTGWDCTMGKEQTYWDPINRSQKSHPNRLRGKLNWMSKGRRVAFNVCGSRNSDANGFPSLEVRRGEGHHHLFIRALVRLPPIGEAIADYPKTSRQFGDGKEGEGESTGGTVGVRRGESIRSKLSENHLRTPKMERTGERQVGSYAYPSGSLG